MDHHRFAGLFPLGSHLCREPMPPMSELRREMETVKRAGFNLIKLQEHWACDEPAEEQYDFTRYEELLAHAAELELGVYLGLTCEQAPGWLWRKYPDCRMVLRDGRPVAYQAPTTLPADGKPGPCFDHPGARADMARFITRLVQTLGRFENLVVWNTWQEIGYWAEGLVGGGVCFCPHTLNHFRRWLTEQHGDLESLNRRWRTRYADWEDVLPSRSESAQGPTAVDAAWQHFMDNVQVAGVLRARAEAIRAADVAGRPIFAHKGGPAFGAGQDWVYARCQDFLGTSVYPAWGPLTGWDDAAQPNPRGPERHEALLAEACAVAYSFDHLRSCNPPGAPLWAAELQGGPLSTNLHKGRVPSPEDVRRWMLTAVGGGASGLCFWVTRAEIMAAEVNGFSLLDSTGDSTPRMEEAARVGRALGEHPELFGPGTCLPAPVALLVSEDNYQFCGRLGAARDHLTYSLRGWHRLLWERGLAVDLLGVGEVPDRGSQYRALVMPVPLVLSEEEAAGLGAFVEAGGHLILEACPGRLDQYGFATRGELSPALAALLGVRHAGLTLVREPEGARRWSLPERTWGEYAEATMLEGVGPLAGHALRASFCLETYEALEAEPCLLYHQRAAGVTRAAGAGRAWLLGTWVGHSALAHRDAAIRPAVAELLSAAGVAPEHEGRLLLRKRRIPGKEAWLLTNPTREELVERVPVPGWAEVRDLLNEPLSRDGHTVTVGVGPLQVRALILQG